jgi:hypothetical protein
MYSKGLAGETETFLRYGATPRWPWARFLHKQGIVRPLLSYTLVSGSRGAAVPDGGLMYDALGGGRQGVFVSAAKDLQGLTGVPASLYVARRASATSAASGCSAGRTSACRRA